MDSKELKEYIIKNNLIEDVLEKIGCHSFMYCSSDIRCALPDDDNPTKVSVNKEDLRVRIFTSGESVYGDLYNLIMYVNKCKFKDAFDLCCNLLKVDKSYKSNTKKSPIDFFKKIKIKKDKKPKQTYYGLDILDRYSKTPHIDLIRKDGIVDIDIINKYHIMFDERTERIVFPHFKYNDKTKIAGIVGRTVNPAFEELKIPKYLSLLDEPYEKKYNLYGLSHNIDNIKKEGIVVVFEAEKSVIKADMFGFPIGVAVGCHEISDFQRKLLIGLNVEICIAFDKDVDEEFIKEICKELSYFRKVSYIKDKYKLLKDKDSPVDRGMKRWKYLFKHRITYKE